MRSETFGYMLTEIYGIFGRACPSEGSPAYRAINRRINEERSLPDAAASYIVDAFGNYDSLPQNLSKAILKEFGNWLSENPDKVARERSCPQCSADVPGFFWVYDDKHALGELVKCTCNEDPNYAHYKPMTHEQARELGYRLERTTAVSRSADEIAELQENKITRVDTSDIAATRKLIATAFANKQATRKSFAF